MDPAGVNNPFFVGTLRKAWFVWPESPISQSGIIHSDLVFHGVFCH